MKRLLVSLAAIVALAAPSAAVGHEIKTADQVVIPSRQAQANVGHYIGCATYFQSERYHTTRVWTVHCHDQANGDVRMHILGVSGCMHAVTMYHIHSGGGWAAYEPPGSHDHGACGWTPSNFP